MHGHQARRQRDLRQRPRHAVVEDCEITGCAKPALAVEQTASAQLARVRVSGGEGLDLYLATRGEVTVADCVFSGSAGQAVHIAGGARRC